MRISVLKHLNPIPPPSGVVSHPPRMRARQLRSSRASPPLRSTAPIFPLLCRSFFSASQRFLLPSCLLHTHASCCQRPYHCNLACAKTATVTHAIQAQPHAWDSLTSIQTKPAANTNLPCGTPPARTCTIMTCFTSFCHAYHHAISATAESTPACSTSTHTSPH